MLTLYNKVQIFAFCTNSEEVCGSDTYPPPPSSSDPSTRCCSAVPTISPLCCGCQRAQTEGGEERGHRGNHQEEGGH